MKVAAIIQARMGSMRLPNKVLADIEGKSMLWHVINRLKRAELVDEIIVATTTNREDEPIIELAEEIKLKWFRGSESGVLDRYYQAAKKYEADVIVRITADCPLVDPQITDKVIKYYLNNKNKFDYVSNILERTYPRGLDTEVFSFNALEKSWYKAKKLYEREHVTPYICEHPETFRLANVENSKDLSYMRWTVDEEKDLEFVRGIYNRLYKKKEVFLMKDVFTLLKKEPHLMQINRKVMQKVSAETAISSASI